MTDWLTFKDVRKMMDDAVFKHDMDLEEAIFNTTLATAVYNDTITSVSFKGHVAFSDWLDRQVAQDGPADDVQDVDFE